MPEARPRCGVLSGIPARCGRDLGHQGAHFPESWPGGQLPQSAQGIAQIVLLTWKLAEHARPDPEAAPLVAEFDRLVGLS